MLNEKSISDAVEILEQARFVQFNSFCKLNRNPGQIREFDRNLKALGMLSNAQDHLKAAGK